MEEVAEEKAPRCGRVGEGPSKAALAGSTMPLSIHHCLLRRSGIGVILVGVLF